MSLSAILRRRLSVALADKAAGKAIADAIDSFGSGPAANVAAIPASTNLPAAACAGGATPSATNVNAAIDTVSAATESRLDANEAKINAIIASLTAAGIMASA